MYNDQAEFDVRCEWGENGVRALAPISDVAIIIDVLSFSTTVDVAVAKGCRIIPHRYRDESAAKVAEEKKAQLAGSRGSGNFSLSPGSLSTIPTGIRLVLPSQNGATLSILTGKTKTLTGCLRNAQAVAAHAQKLGRTIALFPAGERWDDDTLRPAAEDWVGAGAIISFLDGRRSPEAMAAQAAFEAVKSDFAQFLRQTGSGKELIDRGWADDVEWAAKFNCSRCAAQLVDGEYLNMGEN